jgi:8-oxo-dGTP pyrophosphatase MutT (NUDIX family)
MWRRSRCNGATVELEIIHHPGAVAIVPMTPTGSVLLIRQYRHAAGGYIYEVPAGKLDPGEAPADCAVRELEEEIGRRASSVTHLLSCFTTPGFTDEVIHLFLATGLAPGTQHLDQDEVLEIVEMPLEWPSPGSPTAPSATPRPSSAFRLSSSAGNDGCCADAQVPRAHRPSRAIDPCPSILVLPLPGSVWVPPVFCGPWITCIQRPASAPRCSASAGGA